MKFFGNKFPVPTLVAMAVQLVSFKLALYWVTYVEPKTVGKAKPKFVALPLTLMSVGETNTFKLATALVMLPEALVMTTV